MRHYVQTYETAASPPSGLAPPSSLNLQHSPSHSRTTAPPLQFKKDTRPAAARLRCHGVEQDTPSFRALPAGSPTPLLPASPLLHLSSRPASSSCNVVLGHDATKTIVALRPTQIHPFCRALVHTSSHSVPIQQRGESKRLLPRAWLTVHFCLGPLLHVHAVRMPISAKRALCFGQPYPVSLRKLPWIPNPLPALPSPAKWHWLSFSGSLRAHASCTPPSISLHLPIGLSAPASVTMQAGDAAITSSLAPPSMPYDKLSINAAAVLGFAHRLLALIHAQA